MERLSIKEDIIRIDKAIRKHKYLAAWGNVESKQRIKELRERKRELNDMLKAC